MAHPLPDPVREYVSGPGPINPTTLKALLKQQYPQPKPAGQRLATPVEIDQSRRRFRQAIIYNQASQTSSSHRLHSIARDAPTP